MFWGFLFGLIFFVPLLGMALGAAAGAGTGALTDVGIDDNFIRQMREKVTRGTSALFLMTSSGVAERVIPEIEGLKPELVATNLSREQEDRLRELFGESHTEGEAARRDRPRDDVHDAAASKRAGGAS